MSLPRSYGNWPRRLELLLLSLSLLATVIISALTLHQTTRHFEIVRTTEFVARFNSPKMVELREEVDRWLESGESPSQLYDRSIGANHDGLTQSPLTSLSPEQALVAVAQLRTMANYFQEFGSALKASTLNERYAHELLGGVCIRYAVALKPFIDETRKRRERAKLYEEVFWLGTKMEAADRKE